MRELSPLPDGMPSPTTLSVLIGDDTAMFLDGVEIPVGRSDRRSLLVITNSPQIHVDRGPWGDFWVGLAPDGTREAQLYFEKNHGVVDILTTLAPDGQVYAAVTYSLRPIVSNEPIQETLRGYGKTGETKMQQAIDIARERSAYALDGQSIMPGVLDRAAEIGVEMSTNSAFTPAYVQYFQIALQQGEIDWQFDVEKGHYVGHIKPEFLEMDPTLSETPIPEGATDEMLAEIQATNAKRAVDRKKFSQIEFLPPEKIETPDGFTRAGLGTPEVVRQIKDAAMEAARQESAAQIAELQQQVADLQAQLAVNAGIASKEPSVGELVGALVGAGISSSVAVALLFNKGLGLETTALSTTIALSLSAVYASISGAFALQGMQLVNEATGFLSKAKRYVGGKLHWKSN